MGQKKEKWRWSWNINKRCINKWYKNWTNSCKKYWDITTKINPNGSENLITLIYYGRQESWKDTEEANTEFRNIEIIIEYYQNQQYHPDWRF